MNYYNRGNCSYCYCGTRYLQPVYKTVGVPGPTGATGETGVTGATGATGQSMVNNNAFAGFLTQNIVVPGGVLPVEMLSQTTGSDFQVLNNKMFFQPGYYLVTASLVGMHKDVGDFIVEILKDDIPMLGNRVQFATVPDAYQTGTQTMIMSDVNPFSLSWVNNSTGNLELMKATFSVLKLADKD